MQQRDIYSEMTPEVATDAKISADYINDRGKNIAENVVKIGKQLNSMKESIPHGLWLRWVENETFISVSTAQTYMNIAVKNPIIGNLEIGLTVLGMISAPSYPEEASKEIADRSRAGERITVKDAQQANESEQGENWRCPDCGVGTDGEDEYCDEHQEEIDEEPECFCIPESNYVCGFHLAVEAPPKPAPVPPSKPPKSPPTPPEPTYRPIPDLQGIVDLPEYTPSKFDLSYELNIVQECNKAGISIDAVVQDFLENTWTDNVLKAKHGWKQPLAVLGNVKGASNALSICISRVARLSSIPKGMMACPGCNGLGRIPMPDNGIVISEDGIDPKYQAQLDKQAARNQA